MLCAPLGSSYNLASHQNNTKEHTLSHETQLGSSDFSTGWGTLGFYVKPHNRERYLKNILQTYRIGEINTWEKGFPCIILAQNMLLLMIKNSDQRSLGLLPGLNSR